MNIADFYELLFEYAEESLSREKCREMDHSMNEDCHCRCLCNTYTKTVRFIGELYDEDVPEGIHLSLVSRLHIEIKTYRRL